MSSLNTAKGWTLALLGISGLASLAVPFTPQPALASSASLPDPAFQTVWNRTDKAIEDRMAVRSWMWGPEAFKSRYEPYVQGPGGRHLVSYFDKSRMEINDPSADRNSQWFVTNGLLVVDMISGRAQTGDSQFTQLTPASIPVAGDTATSLNAPTYASLAQVASLTSDHRAANRSGQKVRDGLGRNGNVGTVDNLSVYAKYAVYESTLGHNIPDVFWSYLNQQGVVYQNGRYVNDTIVDWLFAMGYPITEPYWVQVSVSGQERWVLMQAFQRRILTYTPSNPVSWQVEMGNVGRAYYDWRYNQKPAPVPTATPVKQAPSISISPNSGDANATVTVSGKNFPASAAVAIGVERADAGYYRSIATVAAKGDGSFSVKVSMPADATRLGQVTITASAKDGIRTATLYTMKYAPAISVAHREIVTNGVLNVQGVGFPGNANIDLGMQFSNDKVEWMARARSENDGSFSANMPVGARAVGTTFKVIASSDGGFKAVAGTTGKILAQPGVSVAPNSGPSGTSVTLRGTNWPPFRGINVGTRAANSKIDAWEPQQIVADASGNFAAQVFISNSYAPNSEIRLVAYDAISSIRMETSYGIISAPTATPLPSVATVAVNPGVLAIGQIGTVTGSNWQAAAIVQIGVGRPGYGVEEWLGSVRADGARNINMTFTLGPRWANAGQVLLTAIIPDVKSAQVPVTIVGSVGRIIPAGLPMTVNTYSHGAQRVIKLNSQGWQPGSVVHLIVVSPDGAVNADMATAVANDQGIVSANFTAAGAWTGRADLGIRATTLEGTQYSLRYLPVATATKVNGSGNAYNVTGFNWPANSVINVVVGTDDENKGEGSIVRTLTTDANGSFNMAVDVPHLPGNNKNDLELRSADQPYSITFDF